MDIVHNLNRCYLRVDKKGEEKGGMEGYRSRMLQKNKIPGLLSMDKRYIDGKEYFYYDISEKQSFSEKMEKITLAAMEKFLEELKCTLEGIAEYLLNQQDICLLPEYIWYDLKNNRWNFLYIPEYGGEQKEEIVQLTEFVMNHLECPEEDLEKFYTFYSEILQNQENVDGTAFVKMWKRKEDNQNRTEEAEREVPEKEVIQSVYEEQEEPGRGKELNFQEKIYTVPYHGIKISQPVPTSLT